MLLLAMSDRDFDGMGCRVLRPWPSPLAPGCTSHARADGVVTLFMNGVPVAQDRALVNLDSASSLKLGHRGGPADTPGSEDDRGFFLKGRIDEVELFVGKALPAPMIRKIAEAGPAGKCKR